jgi:FKBP-type peptidyl-prolyl cis-trans isomerase
MIAGWREAISVMKAGDKDRFWISEDLRRGGGWQERGTLVFDIELVEVW